MVMVEARGRTEDRHLLRHCVSVLDHGTHYATVHELGAIKGIFFNPKRTRNEELSYLGLEIADLTSYPIHKYIKTGTRDSAFMIIEPKFHCYPNHDGCGLKVFPPKK